MFSYSADPSVWLPVFNTCCNASALVLMLSGYAAIRNQRQILHRNLMVAAIVVSAAFLTSYLIYHFAFEDKRYTGEYGFIYYPLLISHILLATVVPFGVGTVVYQAWRGQLAKHRVWARKVLLVWVYVSFTGVVVYFFVHH